MEQYHIHHAINPTFDETEKQPREYEGFVNAFSLQEAYTLSQNDWNNGKSRSTSVGDVIQSNNGFFLVCGLGFKKLEI